MRLGRESMPSVPLQQLLADNVSSPVSSLEAVIKLNQVNGPPKHEAVSLQGEDQPGQLYLLWSVYRHADPMSQVLQAAFHCAFPKQKRTEQPIGLNYPYCQCRKRGNTEVWVYTGITHQDYTQTYRYSYSNDMQATTVIQLE